MVSFESLGTVSYSHYITTGRIFIRFDSVHEHDRHPATSWQQVPQKLTGCRLCGDNSYNLAVLTDFCKAMSIPCNKSSARW